LILADWWMENHGVDPAEHLRGTYHDEGACHRVIFYAGGLVRLVSGICKRSGAATTRDPKDGDFAVLKVGNKRICGIRCGEYWAIRNEQIGFIKQAQVIKAWAI
jgi:hypothetical protein